MRLRAVAVAVFLATVPTTASGHATRSKHRPGCRTKACDWRIDRWLGHLESLRRARARAQTSSSGEAVKASWYDDHGPLACPESQPSDGMAVAALVVRCGTRVRLCHVGCVTAVVDDHGPYIAGRTFDLNADVKAAIGCDDLCEVRWSVAG